MQRSCYTDDVSLQLEFYHRDSGEKTIAALQGELQQLNAVFCQRVSGGS